MGLASAVALSPASLKAPDAVTSICCMWEQDGHTRDSHGRGIALSPPSQAWIPFCGGWPSMVTDFTRDILWGRRKPYQISLLRVSLSMDAISSTRGWDEACGLSTALMYAGFAAASRSFHPCTTMTHGAAWDLPVPTPAGLLLLRSRNCRGSLACMQRPLPRALLSRPRRASWRAIPHRTQTWLVP